MHIIHDKKYLMYDSLLILIGGFDKLMYLNTN